MPKTADLITSPTLERRLGTPHPSLFNWHRVLSMPVSRIVFSHVVVMLSCSVKLGPRPVTHATSFCLREPSSIMSA